MLAGIWQILWDSATIKKKQPKELSRIQMYFFSTIDKEASLIRGEM